MSGFPIGGRVSGDTPDGEVPMRVLGYHGDKGLIVEVLADASSWKQGQVIVVPTLLVTAREEVKYTAGEPEDDKGPAIGWMDLGELSVGLTRDKSDGTLRVTLDSDGERVHVRVSQGISDYLWEGEVT